MLRLVRVGKINAANRRWSATAAAASTPSPPPPSAVAIDAPVDEHCPTDVRAKAHVYKSARGAYDVTLNQTDVAFNKLGHNKFYVMQLLEANALAVDSTNYWLWSRWGRGTMFTFSLLVMFDVFFCFVRAVGSTGQSSLQPGQSLPEMVTMFEQTFKKKTGNKFADRAKFVYKKGNYDMLEIAYEVKDDGGAAAAEAKAKAAAAAKVPSKLPAKVQSLVELIFDTKRMEETMVQLHFDTKKAPLGKLSKTQIKNGYEALKVIDDLVRAGNVKSNELKDANSVYYTRVPHNFGFRMPPLITTVDMVKAETDLLDALSEIEIAMTLISNKGNGDLNVFDKHYNQLNCDIQPLDPSSTEWDVIQKYLKQTHVHNSYKLEIEDVYVLGRKSESSRDNKHIHNHQLLWHGSRLTNFVGLLSQVKVTFTKGNQNK